MRAAGSNRSRQLVGVLIAMAGVGAAFIVAIHGGFAMSGDREPVEIKSLWVGAVMVLTMTLLFGVYALTRGRRFHLRRRAPAPESLHSWEADREHYRNDRTALATCEHLQPVERAMRDAGIDVRFSIPRRVDARCVVNDGQLQQHFALPPSVRYVESVADARSQYDPPTAAIVCVTCPSTIDVVLGELAPPNTRQFPP